MTRITIIRGLQALILSVAIKCCTTVSAQGVAFSVDVQGPTAGSFGTIPGPPDAFYGQEISGGDILTIGDPIQNVPPIPNFPARGPVQIPPGILAFGQNNGVPNSRSLNLAPVPIGGRPELEIEIDAISYGRDDGRAIYFSVDEFSVGIGGDLADQAAIQEASADLFRTMLGQDGNSLVVDGRGGELPNNVLGLGLFEPNQPNPVIDEGDNVDALDVNVLDVDFGNPIYFSLDAAFPDPLENGIPNGPNIGSAQANGFSGADVLISAPNQPPQVFIPAQNLGLNPETDDIDAMALLDVGQIGVFNPGEGDAILFSVRRGSQVIGQVDQAFNLPIGPGDLLVPPQQPGQPPQIFLPAEVLGLAAPRAANIQAVVDPLPDDLDALSFGSQDGDMNCNFEWDPDDVLAFGAALESFLLYDERHPFCGTPAIHGDLSLDGRFDFQDLDRFVEVMTNAGTLDEDEMQAALAAFVPEPSSSQLVLTAMLLFGISFRKRRAT